MRNFVCSFHLIYTSIFSLHHMNFTYDAITRTVYTAWWAAQ